MPTDKQQIWMKGVASGLTPTEAARQAGYADPAESAYRNGRSSLLASSNRAIAAGKGLSVDDLWGVISKGVRATRPQVYRERGEDGKWRTVIENVPDNMVQFKYAELAAKLMGIMPLPEREVNIRADVRVSPEERPPMVTAEMLNLTDGELLEAMKERARQIINGTVPREPRLLESGEG